MLNNRNSYIYPFIFIYLFGAYSVVLFGNYLFHDDWIAFIFDNETFMRSIHGHSYYMSNIQMGRPIATIFTSIGHYFLNTIHDGSWLRAVNIAILSISASLLFKWMDRLGYNKIFSLFFVCTAFTLPPFHMMAIQVNSQHLVIALLLTISAIIVLNNYITKQDLFDNSRLYKITFFLFNFIVIAILLQFIPKFLLILSISLVLFGILHYIYNIKINKQAKISESLSFVLVVYYLQFAMNIYVAVSMFLFAAIVIFLFAPQNTFPNKNSIINSSKLLLIGILSVLLYFINMKLFMHFDNLDYSSAGREFLMDYDFIKKITFYYSVILPKSLSLWIYDKAIIDSLSNFVWLPMVIFVALLFKDYKDKAILRFYTLVITCLCIIISVLPIIAHSYWAPYRTMLSHSMMIYFLLLWILYNLISSVKQYFSVSLLRFNYFNLTVISSAIMLISASFLSNKEIYHNIVFPHQYELNYIRNELIKNNIKSKLENKKAEIVVKTYHDLSFLKENNGKEDAISITYEKFSWLPNVLIAISREHGFKGVITRANFQENVERDSNGSIVKMSFIFPFGKLIMSADENKLPNPLSDKNIIYIDMNKLGKIY